jgi:GNAT superfamily N-acetyltransferase
MSPYRIRPATLDDVEAIVHHRLAMFAEMGTPVEISVVETAFRRWLRDKLPAGTYLAWLVEDAGREVVAGGGATVLPWPPGPRYVGGRLAFVYNVYTEPAHRRRGLARLVMETIHAWCRENGIGLVGLNSSQAGRTLSETMGYQPASSPMMFAAVERD